MAAPPSLGAGKGLHIVVNANAKRGGRRIAVQIARALPGASVRLTRSIQEIEGWLRTIKEPRCILSAGGDGSAVALLNALDRVVPKGERFPPIGALPLGTGNAWAHALGARKLDTCIRALARHEGPVPTKRYGLLTCDGTLTFFAGCGWDAQVLDDYRLQLEASPNAVAKSVWGYLTAMLLRTAPKNILYGRPHVIIENLGGDVYSMTSDRKLVRLADVGRGAILYEGMASVAGAATCPEFGYGFRAYPHAERLLGFMNVRVYDRKANGAILDIPKLWKGQHPLRGMTDWFATEVRMTFSRPMPLQIGGEAIGSRLTVEYKTSDRQVDALDWRLLG
ncbi:MAG TPA: diacylglycerol kinase family protein [Labilithrix sp.]|nr:diacylglycerol kinase family protein [Labilithrix sp.]